MIAEAVIEAAARAGCEVHLAELRHKIAGPLRGVPDWDEVKILYPDLRERWMAMAERMLGAAMNACDAHRRPA